MRTDWDDSAIIYADVAPKISFYRESARVCVSIAKPEANETVLDLACGSSGIVLEEIFRQCPSIDEAICIDSSFEMIVQARQKCTRDNVTFLCSEVEEIDANVQTKVDAVVCNSAFWNFDLDRSINAISRILRPSGRLVFTMAQWDLVLDGSEVDLKYAVIDEVLAKNGFPPKPYRGSPRKFSPHEMLQLLGHAQFTDSQISFFSTQISADDYEMFYRIPAIARRSLPHISAPDAHIVLSEAMNKLRGCELPPLQWAVFRSERR